jgi:hypothetical protein
LLDAERQLKRELQLMEYNRDAETIKANDFKQSLNSEKAKNIELLEKLNQERKQSNLMQEQLSDVRDEVCRMKEHLDHETNNYKTIWYFQQPFINNPFFFLLRFFLFFKSKKLDDEKKRTFELNEYIEVCKKMSINDKRL